MGKKTVRGAEHHSGDGGPHVIMDDYFEMLNHTWVWGTLPTPEFFLATDRWAPAIISSSFLLPPGAPPPALAPGRRRVPMCPAVPDALTRRRRCATANPPPPEATPPQHPRMLGDGDFPSRGSHLPRHRHRRRRARWWMPHKWTTEIPI
ncbi:hypothetical protein PVAP13_9KG290113 [Panicum virgatum]|uniref:Uncharacterized protein n=1 Tax=Panicum virgatum TaxID=38727 RepID=A0A8T0NKA9_PANVG|nr:hypothetical protein PVAP13_9KG290113 [Panicum virgatum]